MSDYRMMYAVRELEIRVESLIHLLKGKGVILESDIALSREELDEESRKRSAEQEAIRRAHSKESWGKIVPGTIVLCYGVKIKVISKSEEPYISLAGMVVEDREPGLYYTKKARKGEILFFNNIPYLHDEKCNII